MSKNTSTPLSRRRVFAGAGAVGALSAAAAVLPLSGPAQDGAAAQPAADAGQGRYQLTQHVLRYYQTAKV
jgi:hypothetical protein